MSIRVPKGVVIDGKAWGGRFVNREQLISLAATVEDTAGLRALGRLAEREYGKAATVHQRAADRYVEAPERWRDRRALAQQVQQEWERVRDAVKDFQETTPPAAPVPTTRQRRGPARERDLRSTRGKGKAGKRAAGKRTGKRAAPVAKKAQSVRPAVKRGPSAVEWELGFKYRSARRTTRRSSDVDVNLRIRRVDGRAFNVAAARKVMEHVRRTQETPDGFLVAGVDWKRPQGGSRGWRHGDVSDLENFWVPMYSRNRDTGAWEIHPQDFRYGAVKQDVEDGDDGDE